MKCPKCGFEQPDDIFCVKCGVEVDKWRSAHKFKAASMKWYAAGAVAALAVAILLWAILSSGKGPDIEDNPGALLTSDQVEPDNLPPDTEPKPIADSQFENPYTPPVKPPATVTQPPPPGNASKPVPDELVPKTLKADALVRLSPADLPSIQGKSRKGFRLYAARDRQMALIPFQIDAGWSKPSEGNWSNSDSILVMSGDLGGLDDSAYPPRGYEAFWRGEAKDDGGSGWAYLFHIDYPPAAAAKSYIKFSPSPDSVSGRHYSLSLAAGHPVTLGSLAFGDGPNLLDRQKLRIASGENEWTEADVQGQFTLDISGPIMARSRWTGTIEGAAGSIPIVVENEYLPDGWSTTYSLDFSSNRLPEGTLRIYFDAAAGADFKIILPDRPDGLPVDGKMEDSERGLNAPWFILAGPQFGVKATPMETMGMFYLDDARLDDAPESSPGCMGCVGFEVRPSDSVQFTIRYSIVPGYRQGGNREAAQADVSGSLQMMESQ